MTSEALKLWLTRWLTPEVFLLLLGGIVWGVQLNIGFVKLTEAVSQLAAENQKQNALMAETTLVLKEITLMHAELRRDFEEEKERDEDHRSNAEQWKRRIALLEQLSKK